MSHLVQIQTKMYDPAAIGAACRRLALAKPVYGTAQLYSGEATGLLVQLPDWQYPLVIDTATGTCQFDNFQEAWGEQHRLDRFIQMYSVEKAKLEAHRRGLPVTEQALADGSIKLQILEQA